MVLEEVLGYLEKRGFKCTASENQVDCNRDDGFGFKIYVKEGVLELSTKGVEDRLREFAKDLNKKELEELVSEYQGMLADIKVLAIRKSIVVKDSVLGFLEEMLEEAE